MNKKTAAIFLAAFLLGGTHAQAGRWLNFHIDLTQLLRFSGGNLNPDARNLVSGIAYGSLVPAIGALSYRPLKDWWNKPHKSIEERLFGIAGIGLTSATLLWAGLSSLNSFASLGENPQ